MARHQIIRNTSRHQCRLPQTLTISPSRQSSEQLHRQLQHPQTCQSRLQTGCSRSQTQTAIRWRDLQIPQDRHGTFRTPIADCQPPAWPGTPALRSLPPQWLPEVARYWILLRTLPPRSRHGAHRVVCLCRWRCPLRCALRQLAPPTRVPGSLHPTRSSHSLG